MRQSSFFRDDDHEPRVKRASVPVAKLIADQWCWLRFGTQEYVHEPDLEAILLAGCRRHEISAAGATSEATPRGTR